MKGEWNAMYKSTHDCLVTEGFDPEQRLMVRSKISVRENAQRYLLVTNGREESVVYAVDGGIVKKGSRCDKLILVKNSETDAGVEKWTEVFVELKGVDVKHAIEQLRQTLSNTLFRHKTNSDIRARIIARSFPSHKLDPAVEKAKQEFRKNYNCDLRGMKTGQMEQL